MAWRPCAEPNAHIGHRFVSSTFYNSENGGEVTRIARAGLTAISTLRALEHVASQAEAVPFAGQLVEFAQILGMPSDTDPKTILTSICVALKQLNNAAPEKEPKAPNVAQATQGIDQLSAVLASALNLPVDAISDQIVTALFGRDAAPAVTAAVAIERAGELTPITAAASFMADAEKHRHAGYADCPVTPAMQAGRLPPALAAWGRDLCSDKPDEFDRFLKSSPFDMKTPAMPLGKSPVSASALAPTLEAAKAIRAQLGLPQGSLRK